MDPQVYMYGSWMELQDYLLKVFFYLLKFLFVLALALVVISKFHPPGGKSTTKGE